VRKLQDLEKCLAACEEIAGLGKVLGSRCGSCRTWKSAWQHVRKLQDMEKCLAAGEEVAGHEKVLGSR
jgi:hypothetical protein